MNRIELVRRLINEQLDDVYSLLAMRLLYPPQWVEVGIEQEIKDLYTYPERLASSYRDEWRAIATRALVNQGFRDHWRTDEENLDAFVSYLHNEAIPRCIHNHIELFRRLGEVLQISKSDNTVRFPDPRRRALMRIIWPEGPP